MSRDGEVTVRLALGRVTEAHNMPSGVEKDLGARRTAGDQPRQIVESAAC